VTRSLQDSSLGELPAPWRERGFARRGGRYLLRPRYRRLVRVRRHDLRSRPPAGPFDLVLCRNLAFTYFASELQLAVLGRLVGALHPGGALVIGLHERLPDQTLGLEPWSEARAVYRLPTNGPAANRSGRTPAKYGRHSR
jgi:chemotaxis protein methyltransferase CheR